LRSRVCYSLVCVGVVVARQIAPTPTLECLTLEQKDSGVPFDSLGDATHGLVPTCMHIGTGSPSTVHCIPFRVELNSGP
jgi:hypothetical protein